MPCRRNPDATVSARRRSSSTTSTRTDQWCREPLLDGCEVQRRNSAGEPGLARRKSAAAARTPLRIRHCPNGSQTAQLMQLWGTRASGDEFEVISSQKYLQI